MYATAALRRLVSSFGAFVAWGGSEVCRRQRHARALFPRRYSSGPTIFTWSRHFFKRASCRHLGAFVPELPSHSYFSPESTQTCDHHKRLYILHTRNVEVGRASILYIQASFVQRKTCRGRLCF
uniref:Uncharacterized protein n=1 Tax=Ixodes ricinus TaxID=34613 RepID=A0A6B0UNX9_IXORI